MEQSCNKHPQNNQIQDIYPYLFRVFFLCNDMRSETGTLKEVWSGKVEISKESLEGCRLDGQAVVVGWRELRSFGFERMHNARFLALQD